MSIIANFFCYLKTANILSLFFGALTEFSLSVLVIMPKGRISFGLTNNLRPDIMKKAAAQAAGSLKLCYSFFVTIYIVTLDGKISGAHALLSFLRFKIIYRLAEV